MDIKQQWQKLAQDLELDFGEDLRPTIELPSMHFMAAKALKSGKLSQSEAILSNPKIQSLIRKVYFGSARGAYRSFEVSLFRGTSYTHGEVSRPIHFVHVILLFKRNLGLDLSIEAKSGLSKLLGALPFGSSLKLDAPGMNQRVSIKAGDKTRAHSLLSSPTVQNKIAVLYDYAPACEISDQAIRYHEQGDIIGRDKAKRLLDLMAAVAQAI